MARTIAKKVTLARALKEKSRNAGKIAQLRESIDENNSRELGVERDIDVMSTLAEMREVERRLIEIKTAIAKANTEIVGDIIALEETKSEIAWLKKLNSKDGTFQCERYGSSSSRYDSIIKGSERIKQIDGDGIPQRTAV